MTPFAVPMDWMLEASAPTIMLDLLIIGGLMFWRRWKGQGKPLPQQLVWLRSVPVVGRIFTPMFVTLKGW